MAIPAHLSNRATRTGQPREPRRTLELETAGALLSGGNANVRIHNLSATGLLIETDAELAPGEPLAVMLPLAGPTLATVVWHSGDLYGCEFSKPLTQPTLSATQLRSAVATSVNLEDMRSASVEESFGMRLRRLRKARKLTLEQIAVRASVSKPTVWAWEQDKARPVDSRLDELAALLGVTREELVDGAEASILAGVVARCRQDIAAAARVVAEKIRILIEL